MDPVTITAIASVIAAGTGVAGAVSGEQQRQAADNEAGRMASKRADAEKTAAAQLKDEEAKANMKAQRDAQAAAARAGARTGRAGTILTSPLGAASQSTPGKTLLGA